MASSIESVHGHDHILLLPPPIPLHPVCSLNDLAEFIKVTSSGLSVEVEEGDYGGLVKVMTHINAVRDRQPTTDDMFEPLKQMIELLKTYGQDMTEEVYKHLEVGEWHVWLQCTGDTRLGLTASCLTIKI